MDIPFCVSFLFEPVVCSVLDESDNLHRGTTEYNHPLLNQNRHQVPYVPSILGGVIANSVA
eukprot:scaffold374835_cov20-Prasinocladus_malaysianus.AAC.1